MRDLTAKIKEILDTPDEQIDIDYAATILLKVNRNRILNQNIIRRGNVAKLRYELQKVYDFRFKEDALNETQILEEKIVSVVKETLPKIESIEKSETKGMRPDHNQLPDEIKAKFLENQNIFPKMRKLHEQLKLMSNAKACDRYPFLQELVEQDHKLRENWDAYDAFTISEDVIIATVDQAKEILLKMEIDPEKVSEEFLNENVGKPVKAFESLMEILKPSLVDGSKIITLSILPENITQNANNIADNANNIAPDAKQISAARKFISLQKGNLAKFKSLEDQSKYLELLTKMQERLTLLIDAKAGVSDAQMEELKALGLNV